VDVASLTLLLGRMQKCKPPITAICWGVLGSKKVRSRGYLADGMSIDKALDSQSIYGRNLWALLSLEFWHQQFID